MIFALLAWFAVCCLVAVLARRYGRSGLLFFALAVLLSPLIAALVLLVLGRREEPPAGPPGPPRQGPDDWSRPPRTRP